MNHKLVYRLYRDEGLGLRRRRFYSALPPACRAPSWAVGLSRTTRSRRSTTTGAALQGLHAKAYIAEAGRDCHVFVGSANATDAAVLARKNVELLVELIGRRHRVSIDRLLGPEGMEPLLLPHQPPADAPSEQDETAIHMLEGARAAIVEPALVASCHRAGHAWGVRLEAGHEISWPSPSVRLAVWPTTLAEDRAVDGATLVRDGKLTISPLGVTSVTGLVAFRLNVPGVTDTVAFVLNVPVTGVPADRDDEILAGAIGNRSDFIRYLLLLLADEDEDGLAGGASSGFGGLIGSWATADGDGISLLEELVRAFGRRPDRLSQADAVIQRLENSARRREILPPGFLELWAAFRSAMRRRQPRAR